MVSPSRRKAFTLIELLIVVAIIAILAAIAVPNFLEAQVRSKTSRCKADMRSLATAIEAYAVDNNHHPNYHYPTYTHAGVVVNNHFFIGGKMTAPQVSPPFDGNPQITTPIAYITSMPMDPFFVVENPDNTLDVRSFLFVNWQYYIDVAGPGDTVGPVAVQRYGKWRLSTGGPDQSRGEKAGDYWNTLYDPSNGTISLGQIHRTQLDPEGVPRI